MIYTLSGDPGHPLESEKIPGWASMWRSGLLPGLLGIQFYFVVHGIESIRKLETYTRRPRS
ncbi:hypothetical protein [Comamonas sp. JC664]|uniref:hypothetical protein n=1 Tax=Comamonas sp. JC664 TaxID=2801917 RepID=UPI00361E93CD